ncbi:uncharacterized protein LOC134298700 [Anolis carolinensis]|uniref:uncharacterized protein LOC134298700 n=1 Tax=Anolis carolinensis TaxID=28377 RepID=UPI002F2B1E8B
MRIHPVFHRSLLLPADGVCPDVNRPPPGPTLVDGEEEFEVQDILDSRIHRRRLQYLIDWVGYGPEERSWEDAFTVHAPDLVQRFHRTYPSKPRPRGSRGAGPVGEGLEGGDSTEWRWTNSKCLADQGKVVDSSPQQEQQGASPHTMEDWQAGREEGVEVPVFPAAARDIEWQSVRKELAQEQKERSPAVKIRLSCRPNWLKGKLPWQPKQH